MTPVKGKEIAWNGIRFVVPAAWEPGRIGPRHLVIESEAGPAMEIKWGPVKGQFSRRAHLRRLSKLTLARGAALREWTPPEDWKQALSRFECAGFAWEAGGEAAVGVILHCPTCRTASVIQFFQPPGRSGAAGQAVAVLASLRDHRDDGRVAWAVYDILALLPRRWPASTGLSSGPRPRQESRRWRGVSGPKAVRGGWRQSWDCAPSGRRASGMSRTGTGFSASWWKAGSRSIRP